MISNHFQFIQLVKSSDLLTFLTLLIAYIAYSWSINRDLDSWNSLFVSLKKDLDAQQAWLSGEYKSLTYKEKASYSPSKVVYPLSFESLSEIIRRGPTGLLYIPEIFINQLSLFNERVTAFNFVLGQIKLASSANPIESETLIDRLNDLGLYEEDVSFDKFKRQIYSLKKKEPCFYLAENIHRLHKILHIELIGDSNTPDGLYYLYNQIDKHVDNILDKFDRKRPWFIRYQILIFMISILAFFIIELKLK